MEESVHVDDGRRMVGWDFHVGAGDVAGRGMRVWGRRRDPCVNLVTLPAQMEI
jgi:hypothetical protein